MKQSNSFEIANLAQQVLQKNPYNRTFFSNQNIRHHLHQFEDAANCKLTDKLLMDFYNATHASLESFQSLIEVQRKIDDHNSELLELQQQLSLSQLELLTDETQEQIKNHVEVLKTSLKEIENSKEYDQNLMCMKKFESEIKKAQDDLTIILSINFDEEKAKAMHGSVELACISSCFCLLLAGLAVMSYFSPAAIGVLMAVIVSVVPFLATAFFGIVAGCFTAGTLAPVVWAFFGSACFTLALLTFSGVCIAAPFFGHAFVALSAICLVFAIASSINAFVLKCKNTEDFIKQNIQSKIEDHITLFQKNSASQMESNENLNVDLERSLNPC